MALLVACVCSVVADARLVVSLPAWLPVTSFLAGAWPFLLCCEGPRWFLCRDVAGQGCFNKEEVLDPAGAFRVRRGGDGFRRLLPESREGRSCSTSTCAGWSSFRWWWYDGGGSGLLDPVRGKHWDVSRLMCSSGSIGSVSGGPPMQLLKPGLAMVLDCVLCRSSPAARGGVGGCSLARDLSVIFVSSRAFLQCVWPRVRLGYSSGFGSVCFVPFRLV